MSATLKPRFDPLLWSQLRPSMISARKAGGDDASQTLSTGNVPLVPENRIATSLRVVLHDTKSVLEQFSDRLGNLLGDMDSTRRQIDKTNNNLETAQEKVLEELVATVNRCQKGLLEVLDTPAQASVLDQVKSTQSDAIKKLEQLESRVGLVQNGLQSIFDQQGQILTCLASLTPMATPLRDVPQQLHHIESQLSHIQPLYQSLPDQLKLVQYETSVQNVQAIRDAFSTAFSTSMERILDSISSVTLESTKLITTAINSREPVVTYIHTNTATGPELPNNHGPGLDQDAPTLAGECQSEQGVPDTISSLCESVDPAPCPSGPREYRHKQKAKRPPLANSTARKKSTKSNATKRKPNVASYLAVKRPTKECNAEPRKLTVHSSDRVLRSRIAQSKILYSKGDQTASLSKKSSLLLADSSDKVLNSSLTHVSSPVVAARLPKRRILLPPSSSDTSQQLDFELDWDETLS